MANEEIIEHNAKEELLRLDKILTEPVLLIGGLAVQRYVSERRSKDIDIVCDLATQKKILCKAYSDPRYDKTESQTDIRPLYKIKDNLTGSTIYIGSKILERDPYPFIDYDVLMEDSVPFYYSGKDVKNIRIPAPHALAYSKIISYIARREDGKGMQDLEDFVKLTNHKDFSLNNFITLSQRLKASEHIEEFYRTAHLTESELDVLSIASPIRFQSLFPIDVLQTLCEHQENTPVFGPVDSNFRLRSIEIKFHYLDEARMKYTKMKRLTATKNNIGSFYDQFHWTGSQLHDFKTLNKQHVLINRPRKNIWRRYEVDFQQILKEGDNVDVELEWDIEDAKWEFNPFISVSINMPTDRLKLSLDANAIQDHISIVNVEVTPLLGSGELVESIKIKGEKGIFVYEDNSPRLMHTYEMSWIVVR